MTPITNYRHASCEECRDLIVQIAEKTSRIEDRTKNARELAAESDTARRLQTMPGLGPMTVLAIEAFAPEMSEFRRGRDFSAGLGLVACQYSSGGRDRLGRITKEGQADTRPVQIIEAMWRLTRLGRRSIAKGSWLARMLAIKPRRLVAIALANKMARAIRSMLIRQEDDRDPARVVAA